VKPFCIQLPTPDEDRIRDGLAHAAKQVEDGEEQDWNPDEIKAAGREHLARLQLRSSMIEQFGIIDPPGPG
jgi:hypothetical protein